MNNDDPSRGDEDTTWSDCGPDLRGTMAEAVAAYAVWRALPTGATVEWPSGEGYDIVTTYRGKQCRINAKAAWRYAAPAGKFYCSPLTIPKYKSGKPKMDVFALVVLEYENLLSQYDQLPDRTVRLEAKAKTDEIYYLSLTKVIRMRTAGDLGPDGNSTARWIISENGLADRRTLSFDDTDDT